MKLEHIIIRLLMSSKTYKLTRDYVDAKTIGSVELKKILILIDKLQKEGVKEIKLEDLTILLTTEFPSMKSDEKEVIEGVLNEVCNIDIENIAVKQSIENFMKKQIAHRVVSSCVEAINDPSKFNIEALRKICDDYDKQNGEVEDDTLMEFELDDLLESESPDAGYESPWSRFDEVAGKFKGGSLILIFATPDTGKSAFCHTLATHLASQCRVLFINNEERAKKVYLRAMCCWTEMSVSEALSNRKEFQRVWDEIKGNYFYRDVTSLTISQLKKYIETDKPDVVFIDQAVKIKIGDSGRHDLTLTEIFKELREIVKKYNIDIVGVSQADAKAYGVKWLKMEHLANVKIGIQGELDVQIGLSRPSDSKYVNVSFPKSKETGGSGKRMKLRLDKNLSRMYEVE